MIPTEGPFVKADIYVNDPANPNKVVKATLPQGSLKWLMDRLAQQGAMTDMSEKMPNQAQIDILGGPQNGRSQGKENY